MTKDTHDTSGLMTIIGDVDADRLFCSGSFTKFMTTYVCLSLLSEHYSIPDMLDDDEFLDRLCQHQQAKSFLRLFQTLIGSQFSIHDVCSYYTGLPYTFDVPVEALDAVEKGHPYKHHSILDEDAFLEMCRHHITPVHANKCKFHYSELSIIFLGYLIEKIYDIKMEELYKKYVLSKFGLKQSVFSRRRVDGLYCQDLSHEYDYPSVAILDHGFFCYSNGFFTTLNDMKILLEHLLHDPVFHLMTDLTYARAASNTIMNGLTVEIRRVNDDVIYGYEGLSFSGCNIWAYSTKHKQGFLTFTNDEDAAYPIIYNHWNYEVFDKVPEHTQVCYRTCLSHRMNNANSTDAMSISIPKEYQGQYQRVNVNESTLEIMFKVGADFIVIRNPDEIKYDLVYADGTYWIKSRDGIHGAKVGFIQSKQGHHYMYHDGTLYKKFHD